MGRGRRLLLFLGAAGLLAVAGAGAAAAMNAKRSAVPQAHAANFPQSIQTAVPPGGDATITTSTLPPQSKQATMDLEPVAGESPSVLRNLLTVLAPEPSRGKRVLVCVLMYVALKNFGEEMEDADLSDPVLGLLLLHACVQIALALPSTPTHGALASLASACSRTDRTVSLKLTHTAAGYHAHLHGLTHKLAGRSPLVTSCRSTPTGGLMFTIRPRSSRATLPSIVGPNLGVGLLSPRTSKTPISVNTTFNVS